MHKLYLPLREAQNNNYVGLQEHAHKNQIEIA
jgi:hypothetical protein